MKKLIIVRHGDYDKKTGELTDAGKWSIEKLAGKLSAHISGPLSIITSPAKRARDSASIIAQINVANSMEQDELLFSDPDVSENCGALYNLLNRRQNEADTFLIVTHYEYLKYFPGYFGKKLLSVKFETSIVRRGEALVIDCERKTSEHIQ